MKGMNGESMRSEDSKTSLKRRNGSDPVFFRFAGLDAQLHEFQVPVAEVAPEELIDRVGGLVKAVNFERGIDGICRGVEAREDPAVFET